MQSMNSKLMNKGVPVEELRRRYHYDGERLIHAIRPSKNVRAGDFADTTINSHGYRHACMTTDGTYKIFYAHRIIFAWVHGHWPANQIDHIDGNKLNNRIENLREVSNAGNARNQKRRSTNTSGHTGIYWHNHANKWAAQITVDGRRMRLGYFHSKSDAIAVRKAAEVEHGFHENHGREMAHV
jgi:hypothetical protein